MANCFVDFRVLRQANSSGGLWSCSRGGAELGVGGLPRASLTSPRHNLPCAGTSAEQNGLQLGNRSHRKITSPKKKYSLQTDYFIDTAHHGTEGALVLGMGGGEVCGSGLNYLFPRHLPVTSGYGDSLPVTAAAMS